MDTETQQILSSDVHGLLQPSSRLHNAFLSIAKQYLDPLAADITEAQLARQKDQRKSRKRKRTGDNDRSRNDLLRMRQIYTDGFGAEQVWQQARRVLDAAAGEVRRVVPDVPEDGTAESDQDGQDSENGDVGHGVNGIGSDDGDFEDSAAGEDRVDEEVDNELEDEDDERLDDGLEDQNISDEHSLDMADETPPSEVSEDEQPTEELVKDKHGLNDGFFSIDAFNKQSEFLERQDARGDPDDGAASDEEEIDWEVDPLSAGAQFSTGNPVRLPTQEHDDDEVDEDDGPTFGNADLNAPDSDDDDDDPQSTLQNGADLMDMGGDFSNTNNIQYADFFAPPARQKSATGRRQRRQRGPKSISPDPERLKGALANESSVDVEEAEMQRAMSAVNRDLFDEDDDLSAASSGADEPAGNLSTHERRQRAFATEIARLERENVANKPWALTGETVAPARPANALLEEDLDFERAGKPVPIVTAELNESIEALIRRRILANEFDEARKRRPGASDTDAAPARRGLAELSDTKPTRGLADEYADDYLRATDPAYVDARSAAVKAKHAALSAQWAALSAQLDALCNWHHRPAAPEAGVVEVRTDAPVVLMEEARPAVDGGAAVAGLAPQETYRPGREGRDKGEVLTRGGTAVAREEETREARRRRRNREKARVRKANGSAVAAATPAVKEVGKDGRPKRAKGAAGRAERQEVVEALKKGGVKVIDKKGELRDVEGKAARTKGQGAGTGAARFLL